MKSLNPYILYDLQFILRQIIGFLSKEKNNWLYPAVLAFCLSILVYGALPLLGLNLITTILSPKTIFLLIIGLIALGVFSYILFLCVKYPEQFLQIVTLYYVLTICVLAFLLKKAKVLPGSSSPFVITNFSSLELVTIFAIPAILIAAPHIFGILKRFPYIIFQILFIIIFIIYLNYHNTDFPFPIRWLEGIPNPEKWRLYLVQYTMLWYSLLLSIITAAIFHKTSSFHDVFDRFNKALIIFYLIEAIVTLLGVPLGMFQQNVDGHVRFKSRFIHPNAYGHHLAIFLVYCLGITLYYQKLQEIGIKRFPIPQLVLCFTLNMAAFFLALSKGAISLSFISMFVILLINFPYLIKNLKLVFQAIGAIIGLIPVGLLIIQVTKEGGLIGYIELTMARVGDTDSFDWRTQAWANLMNNLSDPIIGHGLTSSSLLLHHISYHPKWNPLPLVIIHNTYYQLIYDMGIIGLIFFFIPFALIIISSIFFFIVLYSKHSYVLPLFGTIIGTTMYYLLSMTIDEVNLYDLHILYWPFVTIIYGVFLKIMSDGKAAVEQ
ncbi:MAG: O-antigen ligase family protein [Candidatus Caenarcaniphilales bacterium]|nr:O-antigen ligase family protein [Candidatus Caenarcaniphilales bacterium]